MPFLRPVLGWMGALPLALSQDAKPSQPALPSESGVYVLCTSFRGGRHNKGRRRSRLLTLSGASHAKGALVTSALGTEPPTFHSCKPCARPNGAQRPCRACRRIEFRRRSGPARSNTALRPRARGADTRRIVRRRRQTRSSETPAGGVH